MIYVSDKPQPIVVEEEDELVCEELLEVVTHTDLISLEAVHDVYQFL